MKFINALVVKLIDTKDLKTPFRYPTERYLNIVKRGYLDCNLNKQYLLKALTVR